MAGKSKHIYRVIFQNQSSVYELYARKVSQGELYPFVEIEDIIFGERSNLLVDPSEEKLKSEFGTVKRTFIPLHAIVRIDEVEKEAASKIRPSGDDKSKVTPFPATLPPRKPERS